MVCSKADLQQQEKTVVLHTAEVLCFIAQQHNVTGRNTLVVNFQLTFAKKTICYKRGVTHDLPLQCCSIGMCGKAKFGLDSVFKKLNRPKI